MAAMPAITNKPLSVENVHLPKAVGLISNAFEIRNGEGIFLLLDFVLDISKRELNDEVDPTIFPLYPTPLSLFAYL